MPVHYHSKTFPMLPRTAEEVRAAAHAYEAKAHDYDESGPLIESGIPYIQFIGESLGAYGKQIRIWVCPMVEITEGEHKGGNIGAGDPQVLIVRRFDGRLTPIEMGKRLLKEQLAGVEVEVRYSRQ